MKTEKQQEEEASVKAILEKTINIVDLVKSHPELFRLDRLTTLDKVSLFQSDPKFYGTILNLDDFSGEDKAAAIALLPRLLGKKFTLTDEEVLALSADAYVGLLKKDFAKYIKVEKYDKLKKTQKSEIFVEQAPWFTANGIPAPGLTMAQLTALAKTNPLYVFQSITDLSEYATEYNFWVKMIEFKPSKYKAEFLKYNKTLLNTTELRRVVYRYPDIVKLVDADTFEKSKLTRKQWVLLISTVIKDPKHAATFTGWQFPDDVANILKLDLTAEILKGEATQSRKFQAAMTNVFNPGEEATEGEDEAETVE